MGELAGARNERSGRLVQSGPDLGLRRRTVDDWGLRGDGSGTQESVFVRK